MTKIIKQNEEVVIVGKSGTRTLMPSFEYAKQRAEGLWRGEVRKIEVKTTYIVDNKDLFEKSLEDVRFAIIQLESDKANVINEDVVKFIDSELRELHKQLAELKHSLELINR